MVMNVTQNTFFVCVFCGAEFRDSPVGVVNPSGQQNLNDHMQAHHSEKWRLLKSAVARFGIPATATLTKQDAEDLIDRENQILFDVQMVKNRAADIRLQQREENAMKVAEQVNEEENNLRREENVALSEVFARLAEAEQEVARLRAENEAMLTEKRMEVLEVRRESAEKMAEFQDVSPRSKLDQMVSDGAVSPDLEGSSVDEPAPPRPPRPQPQRSQPQQKAGQTKAQAQKLQAQKPQPQAPQAEKPPAGEAQSQGPEAGDKQE